MTMRDRGAATLAAFCAALEPGHFSRAAGLVDEDQLVRTKLRREFVLRRRKIGPILRFSAVQTSPAVALRMSQEYSCAKRERHGVREGQRSEISPRIVQMKLYSSRLDTEKLCYILHCLAVRDPTETLPLPLSQRAFLLPNWDRAIQFWRRSHVHGRCDPTISNMSLRASR